MSSLLPILLCAVLANVLVCTHVPAWRPFVGVVATFENALGLAVATAITLPVVTLLSYLLSHAVLAPLDLHYLRIVAFVAIVLAVVPVAQMAVMRATQRVPHRPAFTLLMTTNTAVLGVALTLDTRSDDLIGAAALAIACALAFAFMLLAFASLYERLRQADIPHIWRDAPLAAITIGIVALAFMGFTGLIQE